MEESGNELDQVDPEEWTTLGSQGNEGIVKTSKDTTLFRVSKAATPPNPSVLTP